MAYHRPFLCRFPQACALVATGLSTFARSSLTLWRRQYAMSFVLSAIFDVCSGLSRVFGAQALFLCLSQGFCTFPTNRTVPVLSSSSTNT